MKNKLLLIILFFVALGSSQNNDITFIKSESLNIDSFVGIDKFDNTYYIKNNSLFKISKSGEEIAFQDLLLGDISRVDLLNPNKIIVFYQMSNVAIILDNRLTEIDRQDFNTSSPFKNVSHLGSSKDQSLWIYNIDLNQLELYDYRYDRNIIQSLPIDQEIKDLKNNFNFCFLRTSEGILVYNIYGSLIKKIIKKNIKAFDNFKNILIIHSGNEIEIYNENFELKEILKTDLSSYKSFFYNGENLYLYDGQELHQYKINSKK